MSISLDQFKNNNLGKSVASPEGTYPRECVSFVRQKMKQVDGVVTSPIGNAVDFWNSPTMLKYYDKITNFTLQDGDIMVWGDDPGNWTGPNGHIAISCQAKLLNQNYGGSGKVTINDFFAPGYLGALRLKGTSMSKDALTREDIIVLYDLAFDVEDSQVNPDIINAYVGKPLSGLLTQLHIDPSWLAHKNKINNPPAPAVNKQAVIDYLNSNLK